MASFAPKNWEDEPHLLEVLQGKRAPTSKTPLDAAALVDSEERLSGYTDTVASLAPGVCWYDDATETWEARPDGFAFVQFRSTVKDPKAPGEGVMQDGDELVEPLE